MSTRNRYIGRYAPSPTGPLHFGALIAAVASYLDARAHGGTWLVRIEDIDVVRCKPAFADSILQTLEAFALIADAVVVRQTDRSAYYHAALEQLWRTRHVYACDCSRKEIADSAIHRVGVDGPIYPGTCRDKKLEPHDHAQRIIAEARQIDFVDRVQGSQSQNVAREIGDFVLRRRDNVFAYQLAVVVDDAAQGVTHVVRGADLLDSTARQIYLQQMLGYTTPEYLHHPVATNTLGQKLSKQTRAMAVDGRFAPTAQLIAALSFLGQDTAALPTATPRELLAVAVTRWDESRIAPVRSIRTERLSDAVGQTR